MKTNGKNLQANDYLLTYSNEKVIELQMSIGKKLRAKRKEKGYNLKGVAQEIGIGLGTLSEIERGIYTFNVTILIRLVLYYGLEMQLLTRTNK